MTPRLAPVARGLALTVALSAATASRAGAAAAPPSIDAQVSAVNLALDENLQLVVRISRDASQTYQSYTRPDPKDFDVLSQSEAEQTQWSIVNNVQSVRSIEQHIYVMRPRRKGTLTIPPAAAKIDGRELRTREIVVTVTAAPRRGAPLAGQPQPRGLAVDRYGLPVLPPPDGMNGAEDVFIEARVETPRQAAARAQAAAAPEGADAGAPPTPAGAASPSGPVSVHVGEQILVTWVIYSRGELWAYRPIAEPKNDDFWSEEIYSPQGRLSYQRASVKGQDYLVSVLLKRALFPLKAGRLTISPFQVEATTAQTAFYPGASAERSGKAITVDVAPLPAAGRPDGFEAANVGRFEVSATVDNARPKAGEAITLRVLVKGQGNLRSVRLPRLDPLDGFKVYDPTSVDSIERKETGVEGTKLLTYLLLPRKGGPLTVPAIHLPYYDPGEGRYQVAVAPAINITVEGDPEKIGADSGDAKENVLGPRLRPLRIRRHVETSIGERVLRGPALPVGLALPPAVLGLIIAGSALRARLRRETAGSRRRRARATARRHLRAAEQHIKAGRASGLFAESVRAIYAMLELRLGMRCESYTVEELRVLLGERGFEEPVAEAIAGELRAADFARFGATAPEPAELRATLRRVRQLLEAIERAPLRRAS